MLAIECLSSFLSRFSFLEPAYFNKFKLQKNAVGELWTIAGCYSDGRTLSSDYESTDDGPLGGRITRFGDGNAEGSLELVVKCGRRWRIVQ